MEIKKTPKGWEYDGLLFTTKKDALECKASTEKDNTLPEDLKMGSGKVKIIYDSEHHTSFGYFVSQIIINSKGKLTIKSLAEKIGVSKQTFFSWVNGDSLPSAANTEKIRKITRSTKEDIYKALLTNRDKNMARTLGIDLKKINQMYAKHG